MQRLDVFLDGQAAPVGTLSRADDGAVSFRYLRQDLPHPLSLSLPIRDAPFGDVPTRGFFDNLLFENAMRDQVMQKHGIAQTDIVGLLAHLGRDCPGAISVVPEGEGPGKRPGNLETDYTALSAEDLETIMRALRDHRRLPETSDDPSPLAGVQGKLAVTVLPGGQVALPRAGSGAPTTHILKVPRRRDLRLVAQEHALMTIAASLLAHPVAQTKEVGQGDLRGLLVTRFDRSVRGAKVHRIHQEDFCQALSLGPHLKYQRNGTGARQFSARAAGHLLEHCSAPAQARSAFLEGTVVNLLLGNTDNHAKNHSLLYAYDPTGRPQLAPLYDIVPTLIDDQVTHQLSFDIGAAQMADTITARDLERFAQDLGYRSLTAPMRRRLVALTQAVVDRIPEMRGPSHKRLGDGFAEQASALAAALALDLEIPPRDLVVLNRP
ncbi:HipA domain-containing protein [Fluviibacterium sp. DFM31]|uniref:HipA domain-containing protein n=1 Tax=Meridianimarinicoccus marinus TaxID=3231483 RepID=A0ABV3L7S5_9RHOB